MEEHSEHKDLVVTVERLRKQFNPLDVEQLLRAFHVLSEEAVTPESVLSPRQADIPDKARFKEWRSALESFIRQKCFVPPEKVDYLASLQVLMANYRRPLDIFTANYDTSLEVFCLTRSIAFNNGFRGLWKPETLEEEDTDVRLHKVHGSVTWWATDQGTLVEIPVKIEDPETQLYYGAKARASIIYPYSASKSGSGPARDLLPLLRRRLLAADLVVSTGYSFRDDDIREIVWEGMRANPDLLLVLVGPHARQTFESRLREASPGVHSPAVGRTSCLPFTWEGALPILQRPLLFHALDGFRRYREMTASELRNGPNREPVEWGWACARLCDGGLLDLASEILERTDPLRWQFITHLHVGLVGEAMSTWSEDKANGALFSREVERVGQRLVDAARLEVQETSLRLSFDVSPVGSPEGPRSPSEVAKMAADLVAELVTLDQARRDRSSDSESAGTGLHTLSRFLRKNWATPPTLWDSLVGIQGFLNYERTAVFRRDGHSSVPTSLEAGMLADELRSWISPPPATPESFSMSELAARAGLTPLEIGEKLSWAVKMAVNRALHDTKPI